MSDETGSPSKVRWNPTLTSILTKEFASLHRKEPPGQGLLHESISNEDYRDDVFVRLFKNIGVTRVQFNRNYKNSTMAFQDSLNRYGWRYALKKQSTPGDEMGAPLSNALRSPGAPRSPGALRSPGTDTGCSSSVLTNEAASIVSTPPASKKEKVKAKGGGQKKGHGSEFFGSSSYSSDDDMMLPSLCILNPQANKIKFPFITPLGLNPDDFRVTRTKNSHALRVELEIPDAWWEPEKLFDSEKEGSHVWQANMTEAMENVKRNKLFMTVNSPFQIGHFTKDGISYLRFKDKMHALKREGKVIYRRLKALTGEVNPQRIPYVECY